MNDPHLAANKLDQLIDLGDSADDDFKKAAIFAAISALTREFLSREDSFDGYLLEKVTQIQWHMSAALGFEVTNGHDRAQHISWARGAAQTLLNLTEELKNAS